MKSPPPALTHDPKAATCRCYPCRRRRWRTEAPTNGRERLDLCGICGKTRGVVGAGEVERYHPACLARDRAFVADTAASMRAGRRRGD